jgi:hypothetical protein
MAQQTAEHCILIPRGHPNSDNSGSISSLPASGSIGCSNLIVAIGGARLMAPAHSHNHYEETIYGSSAICTTSRYSLTRPAPDTAQANL